MLNKLVQEAHATAILKGWHEEEVSFAEEIALIHSELSEALEEYRSGNEPTKMYHSTIVYYDGKESNTKPEGIPIELADTIIRILTMCGKYGIDLDEAIRIKMEYNKTRTWRHNGKKI
ncbi:MAG: hypothetical protein JM58_09555 [Peptococcaceae bacterium BICA1-8]|nr:MAG: hypothetical protein JM58_09555 [Peptococcaceae bacterium BICA1-8]